MRESELRGWIDRRDFHVLKKAGYIGMSLIRAVITGDLTLTIL